MLRNLFFICVCLIVYIPHTSIQDVSISTKTHQDPVRRGIATNNINIIENLILWLTEQHYQYEVAYYALALNNIFPKFAKYFHEKSEQKYGDIKGLIRLCQILNIDISLKSISSSIVNRPLRLLSPDRIDKNKFVEFLSNLKTSECNTTFSLLTNAYYQTTNIAVPIKIYLKEKLFPKQILTCKLTSDLHVQLDRFSESNSNHHSIPFSFMFADSQAKLMLSQ